MAIVAASALLAAGYVAGRAVDDEPTPATTAVAGAAVPARTVTPPAIDDGTEPVASVAQAIAPAVVQLEVGQGLGSGVVYESGLILTAAHVIEGADQVTVRLADGSEVAGEVVGLNTETDVGVVRFEQADDVPIATLAAEAPLAGDLAVAVGSPFALEQTVTSGVVSAVDRSVNGGPIVGVLQTDAPINPGNSGGPLVNRAGEVIGINSFIQTDGGGSVGLGFAIPVDVARSVADRLVAGEAVEFGFIDVSTGETTDGRSGALVAEVGPGGPAAAAGIQVGDVVTAVAGSPIRSSGELSARIKEFAPGQEVDLTVLRNEAEQTVTVVLGTLG